MMNKILKLTLVTASLLLMQGCATHEKFVQKYDTWVGKNVSKLIAKIGYPDSTFILPSKNKVYVYEKSRVYTVPSFSMMGYGYGGHYGSYGMFGYGSNEVMQESCKLFIETKKKGIIVKWGSRGNNCVSN
jgi:hypothetical protein